MVTGQLRPPRSRSFRVVVAAGVIERDGQILIGQRRIGDTHPLKWEFPGGKVEAGESPRDGLQRELEEELCIQAIIGTELIRYEYQYPGRSPILLIFFRVDSYQGEPRSSAFAQIRWEARERLPEYDFLDGDRDFVKRLASNEI